MREMFAEANLDGFGHTFGNAMKGHLQTAVQLREDDSSATMCNERSTEIDGSSVHTSTGSPVRSPLCLAVVMPRRSASSVATFGLTMCYIFMHLHSAKTAR